MNDLIKTYLDCPSYMSDKEHTHGYLDEYGLCLAKYQHKQIAVCEIGVAAGTSLYLWDRYFTHPNTRIFGVDIKLQNGEKTWEEIKTKMSSRVAAIQSDINCLDSSILSNMKFDIVIDDGSHAINDQLNFINFFLDKINLGGILIIEDITPDDWNKLDFDSKDIKMHKNVKILNDLLPSAFILNNRMKPRHQRNGSGFYSKDSISIIYQKE